MFELSVEDTFSAAHRVRGYSGDCAGIHGHTYRVSVTVKVEALDKLGLAMDFRHIKNTLSKIVKDLDHKNLNKLQFFKRHNATAEWIAVFIYNKMKKKIKSVTSVTVWEGLNASVTYSENEKT
jgi:6-pyruvoyltetrahydropterin/6-carboxytetrahydropterin synthase